MEQFDFSRVTTMSTEQRQAFYDADKRWGEEELGCVAVYQRGKHAGRKCLSKPGKGTSHEGYGNCVAHGGAKKYGRAVGAWLMAHQFAQELNVTPWEALLQVVRITAGRVAYCEKVLATAVDDRQFEGRTRGAVDGMAPPLGMSQDGEVLEDRDLSWWVETSERERTNLAKFSKAAIDAGVAQMLVQNAVGQGEEMAAIAMRALDNMEAAGMPDEWLEVARQKMIEELEGLEGLGAKAIGS